MRALNDISSMENNICTVEDPIEYHLPLINQFQVQERVGLTFSKALRTLLRQDPDVIMVGEIRDEETARTAIQAALTGHLVFSTLHTNDACSADHAADQHGRRAVSDRRGPEHGAGPAAGAADLRQVPAGIRAAAARCARRIERMG